MGKNLIEVAAISILNTEISHRLQFSEPPMGKSLIEVAAVSNLNSKISHRLQFSSLPMGKHPIEFAAITNLNAEISHRLQWVVFYVKTTTHCSLCSGPQAFQFIHKNFYIYNIAHLGVF